MRGHTATSEETLGQDHYCIGSRTKITLDQTIKYLIGDVHRYSENDDGFWETLFTNLYIHPSIVCVIHYRFGRWLWMSRNNPIFGILYIFNRAIYPFVRMYGGVEISPKSQIGPGLCIMHFGPTILAKELIAGENLSILHGTTIASSSNGTPKIGNNVSIGAGATIVGNLVIGDNVTVSAGAVVTKNLPANCVAIGIPARIVNLRNFDKLDE